MLRANIQRDTGLGPKKIKGYKKAGGARYLPQLGSSSYLPEWYGQDLCFLLGQHVLNWGMGRTVCDVITHHSSFGEAFSAAGELRAETGRGGGFLAACDRLCPAAALAPLLHRCRIWDVVRSDLG